MTRLTATPTLAHGTSSGLGTTASLRCTRCPGAPMWTSPRPLLSLPLMVVLLVCLSNKKTTFHKTSLHFYDFPMKTAITRDPSKLVAVSGATNKPIVFLYSLSGKLLGRFAVCFHFSPLFVPHSIVFLTFHIKTQWNHGRIAHGGLGWTDQSILMIVSEFVMILKTTNNNNIHFSLFHTKTHKTATGLFINTMRLGMKLGNLTAGTS